MPIIMINLIIRCIKPYRVQHVGFGRMKREARSAVMVIIWMFSLMKNACTCIGIIAVVHRMRYVSKYVKITERLV